jgi:heparanase 1
VKTWNSTNAEGLIRYLAKKGQPYAFELGNEENGHWPKEGLSPEQEAQSFAKLTAIVAEIYPNLATRPKIIGPDADYQDPNATQALIYKGWEEEFLGNASKYKVPLHAATLHEYIDVGWNGSSWTSLDPDVLDKTGICADDFRDAVRTTAQRVKLPEPEIWAGEIGPHNGGSPPCNRSSMRWANFANSFWYMDAMATKAAHGFSVFCRQDFIGADYGILDCSTQTPLPDYYTSKMWTQLMGTGVLKATVSGPRTLRAYAHCAVGGASASAGAGASAGASDSGDATHDLAILLLNLDNRSVSVDVVTDSGDLHQAARMEWHFTASAAGLGGTGIRLGGTELKWVPGQPLPPMPGTVETTAVPVQVAPQSIVFVRLPGAAPDGLC